MGIGILLRQNCRGEGLTTPSRAEVKMSEALPLLALYAFILWTKTTFRYPSPFFLPPPSSPSPYSCIFLVPSSRTVTGPFFCRSVYHLATSACSPAMKMYQYVPQQLRRNSNSRCGIMSWVGEIDFHTSLSWFSTICTTTSLKPVSLTSRL
jgi:hypothetical protein